MPRHHSFVKQKFKPMSVHDIMDDPWPHDTASKKDLEKALREAFDLERIKPMHVLKVSTQETPTVLCMASCDCCHGIAFAANL